MENGRQQQHVCSKLIYQEVQAIFKTGSEQQNESANAIYAIQIHLPSQVENLL